MENIFRLTHVKLLILITGLCYFASARAADVTITVNGRVVAKPCQISSKNVDIDLGELTASTLSQPGSASAWHAFALTLTNCPAGTSSVKATFSGISDATGYYKNQGSANNIQLQLSDMSGAVLNNGSSTTSTVNEDTASTAFLLQLRALSVNGGTTTGNIQALINVTYTWI